MPLTAAGGANAVNAQEESGAEREKEASPEGNALLPAVKKPKGVEKDSKARAAAAKKKALRRL